MKMVTEFGAFQGDVGFIPCDALPANAIRVSAENGAYIITHSETGHHHVVKERPSVEFYKDAMDEFRSYLVINDYTDLEHLRTTHTHETLRFDPALSKVWRIERQRQPSPSGWERVAD
jgi:hypothetical protein